MSPRARDWLTTGVFLGIIGTLILVGWLNRADPVLPAGEGEPAPGFSLDRIDGGSVALDEYRGSVVMLNVWATWCAPCRLEMPSMQRVYERYRDRGLEVLAVAVDASPGTRQPDGTIQGVVSEFVQELGLTFPVVVDSTGGTERLYGVNGLPTTILIDREGRIRVRELGGRYWDQPPQVDMIEALLEE